MSSWKSSQRVLVGAAIAASFGLAACADTPEPYPSLPPPDLGVENQNLRQLLAGAQSFEKILDVYEKNELTPTLEGPGPLTVVAFTDAAFEALPRPEKEEGAEEEPKVDESRLNLPALANFSIVPGPARRTAELVAAGTLPTQSGQNLFISPMTIKTGTQPDDIETRYVVNGVAQLFGQDACATNGCAFGLDGVVFPDNVFPGSIWDVISAYPLFSTLAAAVNQYDQPIEDKIKAAATREEKEALKATLLKTFLDGTNNGNGFTLIAPRDPGWEGLVNDEGVVTLGREDFSALKTPEQKEQFREQLRQAILYHVVGEEVTTAELEAATSLQTLATAGTTTIAVSTVDSVRTLNADTNPETPESQVTWTGLDTDNGFVHVVSSALRHQ